MEKAEATGLTGGGEERLQLNAALGVAGRQGALTLDLRRGGAGPGDFTAEIVATDLDAPLLLPYLARHLPVTGAPGRIGVGSRAGRHRGSPDGPARARALERQPRAGAGSPRCAPRARGPARLARRRVCAAGSAAWSRLTSPVGDFAEAACSRAPRSANPPAGQPSWPSSGNLGLGPVRLGAPLALEGQLGWPAGGFALRGAQLRFGEVATGEVSRCMPTSPTKAADDSSSARRRGLRRALDLAGEAWASRTRPPSTSSSRPKARS